jgi:hypothetical protein
MICPIINIAKVRRPIASKDKVIRILQHPSSAARCTNFKHLKECKNVSVRFNDTSLVSFLLELFSGTKDNLDVKSPQLLTASDTMRLLSLAEDIETEELLVSANVDISIGHFINHFSAAINKGYVRFAKVLFNSHIQSISNPPFLRLHHHVLERINFLETHCLDRLYKEVGYPFTQVLFELLAGHPHIRCGVPLYLALSAYSRRKTTAATFDSSAKVVEVWEYVLGNFKVESFPSISLPYAVASLNRPLVELLVKSGTAITSEVLHAAFFIRDYNTLEFLLQHIETNAHHHATVNATLLEPASAFHLEPIGNAFRMPYPVQPSDDVFFTMLHKLVELGVYDLSKWRSRVIYDFLDRERDVTTGVVTDLIQIGGAFVTAGAIKPKLELSEFEFMLKQPIKREELDRMKYEWVSPDVAKAKLMISAGVLVTLADLRTAAWISQKGLPLSIRSDTEQRLYEDFFRVMFSGYMKDDGLTCTSSDSSSSASSTQLQNEIRSNLHKLFEKDPDARSLLCILLRGYAKHLTEPLPIVHIVLHELVGAGFPVTQEDVDVADGRGWTEFAELFRGHLGTP